MAQETRRPLLICYFAAAGMLGLFQGVFLALRNQDFGSPEMAIGLGKLALLVAFVTMLLLLLPIAFLRRLHPDWPLDKLRATWTLCVGIVGALAGWMMGEVCAAVLQLKGAP